MGCGLSAPVSDGALKSNEIDKQLREAGKDYDKEVKLLLLGAGESGKSTIAKQMKILYMKGYNVQERKNFVHIVFANIAQSLLTISNAMKFLDIRWAEDREDDMRIVMASAKTLKDFKVTEEIGAALKRIWQDAGVQECFARGNEFQLNDSAAYFLNEIDRLSKDDYVPSEQDLLRTRVKTTGITEISFQYKQLCFRLIDVGGQRSERKKWIHCFEDVTAIIFCVALSAYNQLLAEDEETNRMHESIRLFDSICNNSWFSTTSMVLFLNKIDIFRSKIKTSPLKICFTNYQGKNTFEEASCYIRQVYDSLNRNPDKVIYSHFTCATDTSNIQFVFDAVSDVILNKVLGDLGLVNE